MIRMTEEEYRRMTGQKPANKYHAQRTQLDGKWFDSKGEAERYAVLLQMQKAGLISDLKTQVRFTLIQKSPWQRAVTYIADFTYIENSRQIIEDFKSKATRTRTYRIKKRLMEQMGYEIREVE
jgi:hypothetical protein